MFTIAPHTFQSLRYKIDDFQTVSTLNVLPMALSRQGRLVLHASAVEIDGAALVFVGLSGRGKSTLATSFALQGHALVVDDGLLLEPSAHGWMALPGEAAVRLRRDSQAWLDARLKA